MVDEMSRPNAIKLAFEAWCVENHYKATPNNFNFWMNYVPIGMALSDDFNPSEIEEG